jgi:hypothetical protein
MKRSRQTLVRGHHSNGIIVMSSLSDYCEKYLAAKTAATSCQKVSLIKLKRWTMRTIDLTTLWTSKRALLEASINSDDV